MLIHNSFLKNLQELQELQNIYSIDYTYLTSFNKILEYNMDIGYYEKSIYKVDIYIENTDIIILGTKTIKYECLSNDDINILTYIINIKYKIKDLQNSIDNFYLYLYEYLKNKKYI